MMTTMSICCSMLLDLEKYLTQTSCGWGMEGSMAGVAECAPPVGDLQMERDGGGGIVGWASARASVGERRRDRDRRRAVLVGRADRRGDAARQVGSEDSPGVTTSVPTPTVVRTSSHV